jgi:hypothetical protein
LAAKKAHGIHPDMDSALNANLPFAMMDVAALNHTIL